MGPVSWMYLFLAATAVAIVATLVTGKKGLRRAHFSCVAAMTALLLVTLYFAKESGKALDFPADRHDIHMPLARIAFYSLAAPLLTGLLHWRGKVGKGVHGFGVTLFLLCLVAALGTGAWMMMGATAKAG